MRYEIVNVNSASKFKSIYPICYLVSVDLVQILTDSDVLLVKTDDGRRVFSASLTVSSSEQVNIDQVTPGATGVNIGTQTMDAFGIVLGAFRVPVLQNWTITTINSASNYWAVLEIP